MVVFRRFSGGASENPFPYLEAALRISAGDSGAAGIVVFAQKPIVLSQKLFSATLAFARSHRSSSCHRSSLLLTRSYLLCFSDMVSLWQAKKHPLPFGVVCGFSQ